MSESIDVEYLLNTPGSAVLCSTEEEARQLIKYMKDHYPDKCQHWEIDDTKFDRYGQDGGLGYTFYWTCDGDWRVDNLMFGRMKELLKDGYAALNFYELLETKDIEESEQTIESLFGGTT